MSDCSICYTQQDDFVNCVTCINNVCRDCANQLSPQICPFCRSPYPFIYNLELHTFKSLAWEGNLEGIKWLCENKPKIIPTSKILHVALANGRFDVFIYLYEAGVPYMKYNVSAMNRGAHFGDLQFIKYIRENIGAKVSGVALRCAVHHGYLDIVQYLYGELGVRLNSALFLACRHNHFDIVKYLYEAGMKFDKFLLLFLKSEGHHKMLKYIRRSLGVLCCEKTGTIWSVVSHADLL